MFGLIGGVLGLASGVANTALGVTGGLLQGIGTLLFGVPYAGSYPYHHGYTAEGADNDHIYQQPFHETDHHGGCRHQNDHQKLVHGEAYEAEEVSPAVPGDHFNDPRDHELPPENFFHTPENDYHISGDPHTSVGAHAETDVSTGSKGIQADAGASVNVGNLVQANTDANFSAGSKGLQAEAGAGVNVANLVKADTDAKVNLFNFQDDDHSNSSGRSDFSPAHTGLEFHANLDANLLPVWDHFGHNVGFLDTSGLDLMSFAV